MKGHLTPFDTEELLALAVEHGIDREEALAALDDDTTLEAVRADQQIAHQLGVNGVPYILLDRKLAVPGAVSLDQFRDSIRQVKEMA